MLYQDLFRQECRFSQGSCRQECRSDQELLFPQQCKSYQHPEQEQCVQEVALHIEIEAMEETVIAVIGHVRGATRDMVAMALVVITGQGDARPLLILRIHTGTGVLLVITRQPAIAREEGVPAPTRRMILVLARVLVPVRAPAPGLRLCGRVDPPGGLGRVLTDHLTILRRVQITELRGYRGLNLHPQSVSSIWVVALTVVPTVDPAVIHLVDPVVDRRVVVVATEIVPAHESAL